MKLSGYRDTYYEFTGIASELSRKLSFAGIAVIWIFKINSQPVPTVPEELFLPLTLFVVTLFIDLLQYTFASTIWGLFQWYQERQLSNINNDPELSAPKYFKLPQLLCFMSKLLVLLTAYILLIRFILAKW